MVSKLYIICLHTHTHIYIYTLKTHQSYRSSPTCSLCCFSHMFFIAAKMAITTQHVSSCFTIWSTMKLNTCAILRVYTVYIYIYMQYIIYMHSIYIYIYIYKICVCVKRLYRRKTSMALLNLVFWYYFSFQTSRGMECASDVSIQRRRICCTVIWIGDAQSTYLLNIFSFSSMATG